MKHFLLFIFITISSLLSAQNILKFRPQSLLLKNIALSYEHFFTKKISLQLNGSFVPNQKMINPYFHVNFGEFGDTREQEIIQGYGFSFTPEVRFYYLNEKNQLYDVYLTPYIRYFHYFFEVTGGGRVHDLNGSYQYSGQGQRFAIRPGLQLGKIYSLSKHFKLDLFGGFNMGTQKIEMETQFYQVENMTDQELLNYAKNISKAFTDGTAKALSNQKILLSKQKIWMGLRCGIDICYQF